MIYNTSIINPTKYQITTSYYLSMNYHKSLYGTCYYNQRLLYIVKYHNYDKITSLSTRI